jgi:hypothetical protein
MPTNLKPKSTTSAVILTSTGSTDAVATAVPFGIYTGSADFVSGAALQVAYVYKKLGGDVVDIELTPANVYSAYEEAVLEYSYIINLHQSKNALGDSLGDVTGTFNHKGELVGTVRPTASNLRMPRFQISYAQRVGDGLGTLANIGGTQTIYSGSFKTQKAKQDYDLQSIIEAASESGTDEAGGAVDYAGLVGNNRVHITRVFYKTPRTMWRFYGYYGGINVVGNASTYGQFADDSTFELIPTWQNKMQAIMYEDSIFTRTSHFSYELKNNKLRLFPTPETFGEFDKEFWFQFYIKQDSTADKAGYNDGTLGVNNMNTLPYENLPYKNINSMGKQWIRKYALALCKEMLGQIRGKFTTIPIPGEAVTLNHSELLAQAKAEQDDLKAKLIETLASMEYQELLKTSTEKAEATAKAFTFAPLPIFVG